MCTFGILSTNIQPELSWVGAAGSGGSHELCFGCDAAATSAHLDIFDLRRSLVDWAPARAEQQLGWMGGVVAEASKSGKKRGTFSTPSKALRGSGFRDLGSALRAECGGSFVPGDALKRWGGGFRSTAKLN